MRIARNVFVLLMLAPLGGNADPGDGVEIHVASLIGKGATPEAPAQADLGSRREFEFAMDEITADLPGLLVTSKARSDADQERLRSQGYTPHRHSQHRLGLAWDLVAPQEILEFVAERAREYGFTGLEFPRRLLARKVRGTIVLLVELNANGDVEDLHIDSSDLPAFERFVTRTVKNWKFTPFTQDGQAVAATARLPIPIHIN